MKRIAVAAPSPSPWKLRALLGASLILVGVTGAFTYARFRNEAARRRVETACKAIERDEQDRSAAMDGASKLGPAKTDAAKIASIEKATRLSRVCAPLEAQLTGYRWNFGRHWAPAPVDVGALPSREEIAAIGARARPRCIAQVGMFLDLMSSDGHGPSLEQRQELLDRCDLEKQSREAIANDLSTQPLRLLDEWPALLERMASGVAPAPQPASSSIE